MLKKIRQRLAFGKRSFDPVSYWSTRASDPATSSVMWTNFAYNDLADEHEWNVIEAQINHLSEAARGTVLDLGCGTGRMSQRLAAKFDRYTGVDMTAMVEEARRRHPDLKDSFVDATVETYEFPENAFDFVLSLGCVATACTSDALRRLAPRIARSVRPGGLLLLIEPFHKGALLTRGCRMSMQEVSDLFSSSSASSGEALEPHHRSGMLFPPTRMVFSEKVFAKTPTLTRVGYRVGEAIVRVAPERLSDYKILAFRKAGAATG